MRNNLASDKKNMDMKNKNKINMEKSKKGFISFVLVIILSAAILTALYSYVQSHSLQNYSGALLSEKMYYTVMDAKHNTGHLAEQGLWIGTVIYIIRMLFCAKDCICTYGNLAAWTVTLFGIPLGPVVSELCIVMDIMPFQPCESPVCNIGSGIPQILTEPDLWQSLKPEDDLKQGVTLHLFVNEIARADDDIKVFYVCPDTQQELTDCVQTISSANNLLKGRITFETIKQLSGLGSCNFFYIDSVDPYRLKWSSTCDKHIDVSVMQGYYGTNYTEIYWFGTNSSHVPKSNVTFLAKVKFRGTFGVIVYDTVTGTVKAGRMPETQEFTFSKIVDTSDNQSIIDFFKSVENNSITIYEHAQEVERFVR
jgi:hypothetical protein